MAAAEEAVAHAMGGLQWVGGDIDGRWGPEPAATRGAPEPEALNTLERENEVREAEAKVAEMLAQLEAEAGEGERSGRGGPLDSVREDEAEAELEEAEAEVARAAAEVQKLEQLKAEAPTAEPEGEAADAELAEALDAMHDAAAAAKAKAATATAAAAKKARSVENAVEHAVSTSASNLLKLAPGPAAKAAAAPVRIVTPQQGAPTSGATPVEGAPQRAETTAELEAQGEGGEETQAARHGAPSPLPSLPRPHACHDSAPAPP